MDRAYHILRYGTHAEQKYFLRAKDTYNAIAINGNMVAHSPAAIASFVSDMLIQSKNPNFTYFIDPITHAFQHDPVRLMTVNKKEKQQSIIYDPKKIKKSVSLLIDLYGGPIRRILIDEKRAVRPNDFNENAIKEFGSKVIDYQCTILHNELEKTDILDYVQFAKLNSDFKPGFIIAPYFMLKSNLEWLDINISLVEHCISTYPQHEITAQIVISIDVLRNVEWVKQIAHVYTLSKPAHIMLWIDSFDEHEVGTTELNNFIMLLKLLKTNNITVTNLYGSYFSEVLMKLRLLDGVGHAFEYGESRPVIPVGGGLPTNKYYFYDLHRRIDYSLVSKILYELGYFDRNVEQTKRYKRYCKEICSCPVCKSILVDDMDDFKLFASTEIVLIPKKSGGYQRRLFADTSTKEKCVMHYQFSKYREFKSLKKFSINAIINDAINSKKRYSHYIDIETLSYLDRWVFIWSSLNS